MGGSSEVLVGDTREEVIEKAKKWYMEALQLGLFPRRFVYTPNLVIEFQHCSREDCAVCRGEPIEIYLTIADIKERPKDAESELPFGIFSEGFSEEKKSKRFFCFVSAHS